jgi:hypothetical protein
MDDEVQTLDLRDFELRDLEIERRFEAFARARLTPDPQAVARARARVMREARLQFEAARIASHVVPAMTLGSRPSVARRLAMPVLAASVWLGIAVGSVAASQAGGPLYPARLWVEVTTLPTNAADRTAAEIVRLDARLGDAMTAAARGDAAAVGAALDAYREIADEAIAVSTGREDLEAIVAAALERHRGVLTAVAESLGSKGNATAAAAVEAAIERAIERNSAVVAGFATNGGGRAAGGSGTDAGSGTAAGDDGSSAGSGDSGGATGGTTPGSGTEAGSGAAGGSGGNAAGAGTGTTGGSGNADNGQQGGSKPSRDPQPAPSHDGSTHSGQAPGE